MRSSLTRAALIVSAWTLAVAMSALAAPPQLVNYQGEITDNGVPIADGSYPLEFRIFATSAGGIALWSEAVANVPVANGKFNVLLGLGTPLPEDVFDGTERWLEAVFQAQVMTPRVRLVTVPYAHRISTVDGATGGDISSPVIITTTDPGNSLEVFNTGGGRAGRFENTLGTNPEAALLGVNNGPGPGVSGFSPSGGVAVQSTGDLVVDDFNFFRKFTFDATGTNSSGEMSVLMGDGTETVELRASDASGQGAALRLRQSNGNNGVFLDGDDFDYGSLRMYKGTVETMTLQGGSGSTGSLITLRDDAGTTTINLDGDVSTGDARISVLTGSDVSAAGGGYLVLGSTSATSLALDNNEISSRDNGAYTDLHLQPNGGGVGIGTSGLTVPAGYILAIDGKAIAEEIEVNLSGDWPDYVFEEGYDLMPLDRLEEHVRTMKHLPGIASADQMDGARLPVGEMQTKLLEKIEELTLYVLALNRRLDESSLENVQLRNRLEALEADEN